MMPRRTSRPRGRPGSVGIVILALVVLVLACAPAAPPTPTPAPKPPAPAAQPTAAPKPAPPAAAPAPTAAAAKPAAPAPTVPAKPAAPAAPAPAKPPAGMTTIQHGALSISINWWPNYIAQKRGFYEREGLKVESTVTGSGARGMQALIGGSLHVADVAFDNVVTAVERGGDVTTVAGLVGVSAFSLITVPEVKTIADLKGKTLGVSSPNSGEGLQLKRILIAKGLKENEFSMLTVGGTPERFAGLQKKAIHGAALLQPQDFMLMDEGYNRLLGFYDVLKELTVSAIAVSRKWAQANPEIITRYLKAQIQAHRWLHDPKNKAEALQILNEFVKLDPKYVDRTYQFAVVDQKIHAPDAGLAEPGMKLFIELLAESGEVKPPLPPPSKYYDLTYWQRARTQIGQ